jgi:hypothetical protein
MKVLFLLLFFLLSGCSATPKFHFGQMVTSVVGDKQGQIIAIWCGGLRNYCIYQVRFSDSTTPCLEEFELK